MIVSAHQPHFLPWIGYINRIFLSDVFVIMDNMEYTRNNYISRNRIISPNGVTYISIPIAYKGNSHRLISDVSIDKKRYIHYIKKHIETIRHSYSKKPGFSNFFPVLESVFLNPANDLLSLNMSLLNTLLSYLNIETKIILASSLNIKGKKESDLFIELSKKTLCMSVLLGLGASTKYINKEQVSKSKVELLFQKFKHPEYIQGERTFTSGVSVIDLIFNVTQKEAEKMIKNAGSFEKKI
ncbi:MAG: hypothetical protein CVU05_07730 [Bacteroidetes bacterium HGW-Bacteroidetes-21]|jgi:hypothetical protein|nr:MAG: hypothetical protein CVU05_07730 [Bacteroidetes bacterium HGW-Bacteroidetes-21]